MASIRLFCSDIDGTLIGNPESTRRFLKAWVAIPVGVRPLLCYASGRLIQQVIDLLATGVLPWPDYIIGGVGTQLYDGQRKRPVRGIAAHFAEGWDIGRIQDVVGKLPDARRQPPSFNHPFKSSWYLPQATEEKLAALEKELTDAGLQVSIVYSSSQDLDILPKDANKGFALQWLCRHITVDLEQVLVAGDSGNDSSMFLLPGVKGIIVENAQPELIEAVVRLPTYNATRVLADGVLEGLEHFGVISAPPLPSAAKLGAEEMDPTLAMLFSAEAMGSLTSEERDLIVQGYRHALGALRKNITPMGFAACSPTDNEATGTDANYRRVWARDSGMVIADTIDLSEPDIKAAQRNTLRTIFDHVAANGQVPANVSIDDAMPDYAGVGGICSIDSGMWALIAFYLYTRKTEDFAMLGEYSEQLQRVAGWLSALDSNNDGLLEVPEAGDWTDLFGRSYHILYDEVLWYEANVAYGRLLEFQKRFDEASLFLKRSQFIRGKILSSFWPSTAKTADQKPFAFSESQFLMGDARYLLAEITPFAFNWRCDVVGNVHAFLANVLDGEHARTAFRFMWGVGVNDPFPVVNLYPAVQSGDADWRQYYTVNVLNLPGHYHNGGTWPFAGGMWVRFIHRLGLYEVACKELVKLAQVNRLGRNQEWEFNEWVHSRTGRPMGKCFQAWSASSYIHACQELQVSPEQLSADQQGGRGHMTRGRVAMISTHGYVAAVPPLGATDTGGQVVYVLELSKRLAQLGYEVDIWTRRFEEQPESEPVAEGVQVIRVPCGGTAFIPKEFLYRSIPEWVDNARRLIRERGLSYQFIDSHYWDAGLAGQRLGAALGIPHIHTPHSLGAWKKRQMEEDSPDGAAASESEYNFTERIRYERLIYHRANAVIATTPQQQGILAEEYEVPAGRCHVISPGFDEKRFFPVGHEQRLDIRHRLGFSGNVAMAIGRLARNKGYDLLVNAFAVVARRDPDASLALFVGGDQAHQDEEQMSRELAEQVRTLGLQDRVRFGSFIPDEQLPDYYRAADVFVLSSRYEPFGMTVIEAMACGTACVVSLHGGLSHAITFGLNGLYANPFDPEDLGITIYKVLQYPVLKSRLSRMGAKRVHAHFTWTRIAEQLVALVRRNSAPVSAEPLEESWEETGG